MPFFGKLVDLGFVAPHVFVMYQVLDISEWLTVDYLIVYKALHIVSHIYFYQKSSTLAYVPEDIVMHCLYAKIIFVSTPLFPDVYFVSFTNCVFIVSSVPIVLGHNICVCHLLSNKEISLSTWCVAWSSVASPQRNAPGVNTHRYLRWTRLAESVM